MDRIRSSCLDEGIYHHRYHQPSHLSKSNKLLKSSLTYGKEFQNISRIWIKEEMVTPQPKLNSKANQHNNLIPVLICLVLTILTVTAFSPLKDCNFINLDDNIYIYENAYVQSGLNWNNIGQAFSSELTKVGHWHPITWLSWMLDYSIFGLNPAGFHLINLLFHLLNTILLFLILHRMTKALWASALVAALFAIHPLHVESVAWISERKDVLSTFFWMLTMGAYSYYVEHPGFRRYVFVLLFFALGLMAKPMLITLPFVLLLLDFWPLQRFQEIKPDHEGQPDVLKSVTSGSQNKKSKKNQAAVVKETSHIKRPSDPKYKWSVIYPLIWEKVPLFILAILSSIVTYIAAQSVGAVSSIKAIPLDVRIGNAFVSYVTYLVKMIWPINLAVFYPYPGVLVSWQVFGSVSLLIAITVVVFRTLKKTPYLASGWLWYLGTLVPVIGIVQAGPQAMADRYTYIPLIGLFIMVAWGLPDLLKKWSHRKEILLALSALSILCLSILTWIQVGYWQNSIKLFSHALQITTDNYLAHDNLGVALDEEGKGQEAILHYQAALEIKPQHANAYYNMGNVYKELGNMDKAFEYFQKVIRLKPDFADAQNNIGIILEIHYKKNTEAIDHYRRALAVKPSDPGFHFNLAMALMKEGKSQEAIQHLRQAINLRPDYEAARRALKMAQEVEQSRQR